MNEIDCRELTADEQLALAGAITGALQGKGVALVRGSSIVIDWLGGEPADDEAALAAILEFLARRHEANQYTVEKGARGWVLHSPDPVRASKRRRQAGLPPNLMKCPFCSFVTPYEEEYVVHYRSHGFGA
jgi:hypothetical protein